MLPVSQAILDPGYIGQAFSEWYDLLWQGASSLVITGQLIGNCLGQTGGLPVTSGLEESGEICDAEGTGTRSSLRSARKSSGALTGSRTRCVVGQQERTGRPYCSAAH